MKAKVVSDIVYDNIMDHVHGFGREIKRLVVEGKGCYLALTPFEQHVYVYPFEFSASTRVLGEVDVPDSLTERVQQATELQKQLSDEVQDTFRKF